MTVKLNNLIQFLDAKQLIELKNVNKEIIYNGEFHLLTSSSQWLDVRDLHVLDVDPQEDKSLNIEVGNVPDREDAFKETVFYGKDYKVMQVYCKVKTENAIKIKERYRQVHKKILDIKTDKFYKVEVTNHTDEEVSIMVNYTKLVFCYDEEKEEGTWIKSSEERMLLELDFDDVDFSYFFEYTTKETVEKVQF